MFNRNFINHEKPVQAVYQSLPILIDQGDKDSFLSEQLKPEIFCETADKLGISYQFNLREGYDHSYYFIAGFIGGHIAFHAKHLQG